MLEKKQLNSETEWIPFLKYCTENGGDCTGAANDGSVLPQTVTKSTADPHSS